MSVMKNIVKIVAVMYIYFPLLAYGSENEWKEFLKLKEQYYYLDKQQFNEINCVVEAPLMENFIKQTKQQLAPIQENVEIRENIDSFALTYSPKHGLSFTDPTFDIILKNKDGITNPKKINEGIGIIKNGFKMHIDGLKDALNGLFEDYLYPQKENYKNLKLVKNNKGITVKYVNKNSNISENYFGNLIKTTQSGINTKNTSIQKYLITTNNKLILKQGSISIHQPKETVKMNIYIKYQHVKNVIFPKNIKTEFEQTIQTTSQKGTSDINLINCKMK